MSDSKVVLTTQQCKDLAAGVWEDLLQLHFQQPVVRVWGVPRGGIPASYLIHAVDPSRIVLANTSEDADVIVDDLIDSGRTAEKYRMSYPSKPFVPLLDKRTSAWFGKWVVFPWELAENGGDESATDIVIRLLQYIGEDPKRGGLVDTPERALRAWKEWTAGYRLDPHEVLKTFEDGSEKYDEMVTVKDLPFFSHCEHHLAPFFGTATVAYVPNQKIVGLSKIGRVLNIFSRRLQVQERLTTQIADALFSHLEPRGVGVVLRARHLCMESRGLATQGHFTVTTALRGVFLEDSKARSEFLSIA